MISLTLFRSRPSEKLLPKSFCSPAARRRKAKHFSKNFDVNFSTRIYIGNMLNIPECVPKQLVEELEGYQKQIKILIRNYKVSMFVDIMTYYYVFLLSSQTMYVPKYLPVFLWLFMHIYKKRIYFFISDFERSSTK